MAYMTPTKILFCNLSSNIGGAEITLLDLLIKINKEKFLPILLLPSPGAFSYECERRGVAVMFLRSLPHPGGPVIKTYGTILINVFQIAKIIRNENINIVHANSPRAAYHACLAAKLMGKPSIIHVKDYWDSPFHSKIKSIFLNLICDRIITVSNIAFIEIAKQFPPLANKISVIYDGIQSKPNNNKEEVEKLKEEWNICGCFPLIACIGSISELKGQEIAIRAIPEVINKYPKTMLLLIGETIQESDKNYLNFLKDLIFELGLTNHVKFCGFQSNIYLWIDAIDFLVHPATLPDALPHVLLEAGRAGKICIASNIGGISEIIEDNKTGILVKPNDPFGLAKAIIEILNDPQKRNDIEREAIRNIKTRFSMSTYVNSIQSIYHELIS